MLGLPVGFGREAEALPVEPGPERPGLVLPAWVKRVVLLKDADTKDPRVVERLLMRAAGRWEGEGRAVHQADPPAGMDFNYRLRQGVAA